MKFNILLREKFIYFLQVDQVLTMPCRCRAQDFDITGRNKINIFLSSLQLNILFIIYTVIIIIETCLLLITHSDYKLSSFFPNYLAISEFSD